MTDILEQILAQLPQDVPGLKETYYKLASEACMEIKRSLPQEVREALQDDDDPQSFLGAIKFYAITSFIRGDLGSVSEMEVLHQRYNNYLDAAADNLVDMWSAIVEEQKEAGNIISAAPTKEALVAKVNQVVEKYAAQIIADQSPPGQKH